jgi:hypothetical protein
MGFSEAIMKKEKGTVSLWPCVRAFARNFCGQLNIFIYNGIH